MTKQATTDALDMMVANGLINGLARAHLKAGDNLEVDLEYLVKLVAAARLEGWQAARETAVELAEREVRDANTRAVPVAAGGASMVMHAIRAMQPPAEWQCAEVTPVCGAAPNDPWPHPDGFAGGLMERQTTTDAGH